MTDLRPGSGKRGVSSFPALYTQSDLDEMNRDELRKVMEEQRKLAATLKVIKAESWHDLDGDLHLVFRRSAAATINGKLPYPELIAPKKDNTPPQGKD